jgi:hypothetical protein
MKILDMLKYEDTPLNYERRRTFMALLIVFIFIMWLIYCDYIIKDILNFKRGTSQYSMAFYFFSTFFGTILVYLFNYFCASVIFIDKTIYKNDDNRFYIKIYNNSKTNAYEFKLVLYAIDQKSTGKVFSKFINVKHEKNIFVIPTSSFLNNECLCVEIPSEIGGFNLCAYAQYIAGVLNTKIFCNKELIYFCDESSFPK